MGIAYANLRLSNDARPDLEELDADALVDTGTLHLCIPEALAQRLALKHTGTRRVTLADGGVREVRYVSPIRVELLGRVCVTGALVLGDQVLLGAIPMEDMDLLVEPARQRVITPPESPDAPRSIAKSMASAHP
jgi:clan AA aspartic protease